MKVLCETCNFAEVQPVHFHLHKGHRALRKSQYMSSGDEEPVFIRERPKHTGLWYSKTPVPLWFQEQHLKDTFNTHERTYEEHQKALAEEEQRIEREIDEALHAMEEDEHEHEHFTRSLLSEHTTYIYIAIPLVFILFVALIATSRQRRNTPLVVTQEPRAYTQHTVSPYNQNTITSALYDESYRQVPLVGF